MPPRTRPAAIAMRIGIAGTVLGALIAAAAYFGIALCLSGSRCVADPTALFALLFSALGAIAVAILICLFALWLRRRAQRRFLQR